MESKPKFLSKYVKPWFFSSESPDKIKPVRVAITVMIHLIFAAIIIKFISPGRLSDTFVLGLAAKLAILIGADTWRSNSKTKAASKIMSHDGPGPGYGKSDTGGK